MKRGEIRTVAGGPEYAGKPRAAVILEDDRFDATGSITVCGITTSAVGSPLFRVPLEPSETNGLELPCRLMADRITTVRRSEP